MKKRMLCGVLSAAVLFGTYPVCAFAEDTQDTPNVTEDTSVDTPDTSNPSDTSENPSDTIHILNTKIMDFRNQEEDASGDGWYWNANTQTLTLKDFRYSVPFGKLEDAAAICLPKDSYVEIKSDNNLLETKSFHCDAFYCEGEVNFYGDGALTLTLDSYGANAIYVKEGPLMIDDEVEITVESRGYVIYLDNAKGKNPLITIEDDAKLIFKKKDHKDRNILLTKKSNVETSPNWLDYSEVEDEWDEDYINLVEKKIVNQPEKEEPAAPSEPETTLDTYKIMIGNGEILKNDKISYTADVVPYLNENGYTMLPLRALLMVSNPEQKVNWNNGTKSAHTFINNKLVSIQPGEATYSRATEKINLYTPAETKDGRLFVSLRDWMKIMEIDVSKLDWDAETKTITLTY